MREILFRGQTRRLGEKVWMNGEKVPSNWVYGGVCQGSGDFSIIYGSYDEKMEKPFDKHCVYTDTLGQYTGLTDKNGKEIFEGDIVKFVDIIGVINYGFGCFCVKTNKPDWKSRNNPAIDIVMNEYTNEVEIIGNIHDNPELLKGETK